jgi:hypothetical protein
VRGGLLTVAEETEPVRARGYASDPSGRLVPVEVDVPPGPIADALREGTLRGVSLPPEYREAAARALGSFVRAQEPADPVEFVAVAPEDSVRVRLPDTATIPPPVLAAIEQLATACREEYGYGVEVIPDDRDDVYAALDLIRRHVDR